MNTALFELTRLVASSECLLCAEVEAPLCGACLDHLERARGGCGRCGQPNVHPDAQECKWCRSLDVLGEDIFSFYVYRNEGSKLYQLVKYDGYWRLVHLLAREGMGDFFGSFDFRSYDGLVPIPESWKRKLTRHFNPADMLARSLSSMTGLPRLPLLGAHPLAKPQVGLSFEARRQNVRSRFHVKRKTMPSSVILVDDVLTSGATMASATHTLKAAGVKRVAWLSLFRTP